MLENQLSINRKLIRSEFINKFTSMLTGTIKYKLYWKNLLANTFDSENFESTFSLTQRFSGTFFNTMCDFLDWYKNQLIEEIRNKKINNLLDEV